MGAVDKNRVFVLGLDGATFDLVRPWIAQGKLPNLSQFLEDGCHAELESTIPPLTTPAWASFITGKNPGKHGIFDFCERVPNNYDIRWYTSLSRGGKSIWRIASDHGKRVGIINIPNNYPVEKINGFAIAWMDAPGVDSDFIYPRQLYDDIKKEVGEYIITILDWQENEDPYKLKQNLLKMLNNRWKVTKFLMNRYSWDLFMVLFTATDIVQHCFWKFMDPYHPRHDPAQRKTHGDSILEIYTRVDEILGELLEILGEKVTIITMSDHGAGKLRYVINLNRWLEQQGFLVFRNQLHSPAVAILRRGIRGALSLFKKHTSLEMRAKLKKLVPGTRDKIEGLLFSTLFDWSRTKAYSLGSYGNIYINLKGREPQGIVNEGKEYESLREQIILRLQELVDPDMGEKVVHRVLRREEIYHGASLYKAPDLVVEWSDAGYHSVQRFGSKEETVFCPLLTFHLTNLEFSGCHRMNGVFAIKGEMIKKGLTLPRCRIIDLAPTLLYLLGVPVPDDMDGQVLTAVFDDNYLRVNPVAFSRGEDKMLTTEERDIYSEKEKREIQRRLKSLGYLE